MKMLDKTEQSDRVPNANEKPENCYCSALPKGSGLCLPCYTRWLADERPRPGNSTSKSLAQMNKSPDVGKATKKR
jgi:hypothetical protein